MKLLAVVIPFLVFGKAKTTNILTRINNFTPLCIDSTDHQRDSCEGVSSLVPATANLFPTASKSSVGGGAGPRAAHTRSAGEFSSISALLMGTGTHFTDRSGQRSQRFCWGCWGNRFWGETLPPAHEPCEKYFIHRVLSRRFWTPESLSGPSRHLKENGEPPRVPVLGNT